MKKISTLYKKDLNNLNLVTKELDPDNTWVIDGDGIPTRKFDGTATAIINGEIYKRYDVKKGKQVPNGAIPCQEPDKFTGHWPHWVKCDKNKKEDQYFFEGFNSLSKVEDGTYELCGEKIGTNAEKITGNILIKHGSEILPITDFSFEGLKEYLSNSNLDIEGIVFHHKTDGRMCKIRKCDFGIKRLK